MDAEHQPTEYKAGHLTDYVARTVATEFAQPDDRLPAPGRDGGPCGW